MPMPTDAQIDQISIIGRVAFGITCLERVCEAWEIRGFHMERFIEHLWDFTSSEDLSTWENDILKMLPEVEGVGYLYAEAFGFQYLDQEYQNRMALLLDDIVQIGRGNLYSGFVSSISREPLIRVATMLEKAGIPVPDIKPFARSQCLRNAWLGQSCDPPFFRQP